MFALLGTLVFASGGPGESEEELLGELLALKKAVRDPYYQDADPTVYAEMFAFKATYFDPCSWGQAGGRCHQGVLSLSTYSSFHCECSPCAVYYEESGHEIEPTENIEINRVFDFSDVPVHMVSYDPRYALFNKKDYWGVIKDTTPGAQPGKKECIVPPCRMGLRSTHLKGISPKWASF
jgi:hypothetical protein